MASISSSCWELDLSSDLLDLILGKIAPLADCIRFSLVCKTWRSVMLEQFQQNGLKNRSTILHDHQQLPLLLVPSKDNCEEKRSLYNVTNKKVYESQLSVPYNRRCCGSSHGWLVTNDETMAISLMNPFSGAIIRLPPVIDCYSTDIELIDDDACIYPHDGNYSEGKHDHDNRINDVEDSDNDDHGGGGDDNEDDDDDDDDDEEDYDFDEENEDYEEEAYQYQNNYEYCIHKVILSKDPDLYPDDYVVMVIYGCMKRLAFVKSGDKDWNYIDRTLRLFNDVIYYQDKFYALHHWGKVVSCEINISHDQPSCSPRINKIVAAFRPFREALKCYLVELPKGGGLVMVYRFLTTNWMTKRFDVLKLIILQAKEGSVTKWVKTCSIGDAAIFLGDSYSTSVSASDYPAGCQADSIYFTDDFIDIYKVITPFSCHGGGGPCDNGVFNIKQKTFEQHYELHPSQQHMPPPIWILPKFIKSCTT